ncbi:MAG: response regulator transcription factor, partial [Marmoricola sp.]
MTHRLLVIEDDDSIAEPLVRALIRESYQVDRVGTGAAGRERAAQGGIDLILLDLGLPDADGLEICQTLRADGYAGGILILTARVGELDRVVGLDVGADDYLSKPFGLAELTARVRALLRRTTAVAEASAPVAPDPPPEGLRVDTAARRVWVDDAEIALTTKEFDLLALLHAEQGSVITRERLMDEVWDENWFGSTKTLDVTTGRLRQKLEESGAPASIVTVR